jgi:hypothetical protein
VNEPQPAFTRHFRDDGSWYVTVDYWPDEMDISVQFLSTTEPALVRRTHNPEYFADEVTIRCANGEATYRLDHHGPVRGVHRAKAVRRRLVGDVLCRLPVTDRGGVLDGT